MAARRRIDPGEGMTALRRWAREQGPDRSTTAAAVRFTLEELSSTAPGGSVEVRVPPFGVTQAVAGTTHRRGTPPSVVETDPSTWLALATGRTAWIEAVETGRLRASGERSDLSPYLPLVRIPSQDGDGGGTPVGPEQDNATN